MGGETGACLVVDGSLVVVVADDDLRRERGWCWEEAGADRRRSLWIVHEKEWMASAVLPAVSVVLFVCTWVCIGLRCWRRCGPARPQNPFPMCTPDTHHTKGDVARQHAFLPLSPLAHPACFSLGQGVIVPSSYLNHTLHPTHADTQTDRQMPSSSHPLENIRTYRCPQRPDQLRQDSVGGALAEPQPPEAALPPRKHLARTCEGQCVVGAQGRCGDGGVPQGHHMPRTQLILTQEKGTDRQTGVWEGLTE